MEKKWEIGKKKTLTKAFLDFFFFNKKFLSAKRVFLGGNRKEKTGSPPNLGFKMKNVFPPFFFPKRPKKNVPPGKNSFKHLGESAPIILFIGKIF